MGKTTDQIIREMKMLNKELSDFTCTVLPILAIPVVVTAWIIHTVSNRIVDY